MILAQPPFVVDPGNHIEANGKGSRMRPSELVEAALGAALCEALGNRAHELVVQARSKHWR